MPPCLKETLVLITVLGLVPCDELIFMSMLPVIGYLQQLTFYLMVNLGGYREIDSITSNLPS